MKYRGTFVLLSILFLYSILYSFGSNEINHIVDVIEKTGASMERVEIEGNAEFISNDDLTSMVEKIYKKSGIIYKYKVEKGNDNVQMTSDNFSIKVKKISKENLVYASFALSQHVYNGNINNIRRTILKAFAVYNIRPSFSFLFEGKYTTRLTISQMKNIASQVFKLSRAEYVSSMDDGNVVSLSGFVPGISEKIRVADKEVNLNIALRYSKQNSCTYIWIGSPIIATEY